MLPLTMNRFIFLLLVTLLFKLKFNVMLLPPAQWFWDHGISSSLKHITASPQPTVEPLLGTQGFCTHHITIVAVSTSYMFGLTPPGFDDVRLLGASRISAVQYVSHIGETGCLLSDRIVWFSNNSQTCLEMGTSTW